MKQQRMTKQKQMVMDAVRSHYDHPTADQVFLEVRGKDGHISRATVYRNLEQLSDAGVLLHVKVPGPDRYDSRLEYHYHMVCKNCGAVLDIPLDYQYQMDKELEEETGYAVDRHRTFFEGLCADCRTKSGSTTEATPVNGSCGSTKHP